MSLPQNRDHFWETCCRFAVSGFLAITKLEKIEETITALPDKEFWQFANWFAGLKAARWDSQIEDDAKAGRLDKFISDAKAEIAAGRIRGLI